MKWAFLMKIVTIKIYYIHILISNMHAQFRQSRFTSIYQIFLLPLFSQDKYCYFSFLTSQTNIFSSLSDWDKIKYFIRKKLNQKFKSKSICYQFHFTINSTTFVPVNLIKYSNNFLFRLSNEIIMINYNVMFCHLKYLLFSVKRNQKQKTKNKIITSIFLSNFILEFWTFFLLFFLYF